MSRTPQQIILWSLQQYNYQQLSFLFLAKTVLLQIQSYLGYILVVYNKYFNKCESKFTLRAPECSENLPIKRKVTKLIYFNFTCELGGGEGGGLPIHPQPWRHQSSPNEAGWHRTTIGKPDQMSQVVKLYDFSKTSQVCLKLRRVFKELLQRKTSKTSKENDANRLMAGESLNL